MVDKIMCLFDCGGVVVSILFIYVLDNCIYDLDVVRKVVVKWLIRIMYFCFLLRSMIVCNMSRKIICLLLLLGRYVYIEL